MNRYFLVFYLGIDKEGRTYPKTAAFATKDNAFLNELSVTLTLMKANALIHVYISNYKELTEAEYNQWCKKDPAQLEEFVAYERSIFPPAPKSSEEQPQRMDLRAEDWPSSDVEAEEKKQFELQKKALEERAERLRRITISGQNLVTGNFVPPTDKP